jgi:hypothetical protein
MKIKTTKPQLKTSPSGSRKKTNQNLKPASLHHETQHGLTPSIVMDWQHNFGNTAVSQALEENPNQNLVKSISQQQSGGNTLPADLKRDVEQEFQTQLGPVRIHTNERAHALSQSVNALALTAGRDIFFSRGAYNPKTISGLRLLKHELAHVVQQGGQLSADMKLGEPDSSAEREAETISAGTSSYRSKRPTAYSAAGAIQRVWWPWQKEKTKKLSGTANEVYQMQHKGGSTGYFKPDTERVDDTNKKSPLKSLSNMGARSVLSSDIDKTLGFNVLANETYRTHKGKGGSESEAVEGESLTSNHFTPISKKQYKKEVTEDGEDPNGYKVQKGLFRNKYAKLGQVSFNRHDYMHPNIQKGLSNIQLEDAITGQRDRHGGNIKINDQNHEVKAYDNDLIDIASPSTNSLSAIPNLHRPMEEVTENDGNGGTRTVKRKKALTPGEEALRAEARKKAMTNVDSRQTNVIGHHKTGLPSFIDEASAQRIAGMKSQAFIDQLTARNSQNAARMDPAHLQELKDRYSTVRRYVKGGLMPAAQKPENAPNIIRAANGGWNNETYHAQVSQYDPMKADTRNYLQRSVRTYNFLAAKPGGTMNMGGATYKAEQADVSRLPMRPMNPAPAANNLAPVANNAANIAPPPLANNDYIAPPPLPDNDYIAPPTANIAPPVTHFSNNDFM